MDNEALWAAAMAATGGEGDHEKRAEDLLNLVADIAADILIRSVELGYCDVRSDAAAAVSDVLRFGRDGGR